MFLLIIIFYLEKKMEKSYKFKYQSSKKALEAINRFNYYLEQVIPIQFTNQIINKTTGLNQVKYASGTNNIIYFWTKKFIEGELLVNQQSIMHAIKSTNLQKNNENDRISKINQKSYKKVTMLGGSLLMAQWMAAEVMEFVLKPGENKAGRKLPFQLYVIHHCHTQNDFQNKKQLKWLHYVEKYIFAQDGMHYQMVVVANQQKAMFGLYSNISTIQTYIKRYLKLQAFQGYLLKYQDSVKKQIQQSEDPAFSEQHKLINSIPSQFLKTFYTLRNYFGAEHQQLICRYMLAREFNLQESKQGIKNYLDYMKQLNQKYKWEDFQEFHKANIYYELGQDYKGRPVLLNMAKNVLVDQIDANKYCEYFIYHLEIYMAKKMRGHVSQLNIIADVADIGPKNFKLAITKRNVDDGKHYCVERQYKFFAVNISSFANFCYKFIKPLLPKKTSDKVYIGGNDKKEIVQNLLKDMSIDVIPTYLGGRNPII